MAIQTDFYTIAGQEKAQVFSVTSEATGRDIEFAFDHDLNTWWEATNTSDQTIILDMQEAITVDTIGVFLKNYNTDIDTSDAGTSTLAIDWSNTGTGGAWTSLTTSAIADIRTHGQPVMFKTAGATQSARYFRIVFSNMAQVAQVAHIFIARKRSLTAHSLYPQQDSRTYSRRTKRGVGQRLARNAFNKIPIEILTRHWILTESADNTLINGVVTDCAGRYRPMIIQEDSNEAQVVRIIDKRNRVGGVHYQIWRPRLTMETLPYILDGEIL